MAELLGDRYRLGDSFGRGPTGQVSFAVDTDDHEVAIKVVRPDLVDEPDAVARIAGHVAELRRLDGRHLVRLIDVVTVRDTIAIVMESVRGGDLRQHLTQVGTVLPAEVSRIGAEVADALADVHRSGYLYLDLKPTNIMLDQFTAPRAARVTDLGVAALVLSGARARQAVLTAEPHYVAPELAAPDAVPTPAADLYSLGVVLYELCCGVTPFAGASTRELVALGASSEPGRPDGVPDELWRVIASLLARDPADRPSSAGDVASLLRPLVSALEHQPCALRLTTPPPPRRTATTDSSLPPPPAATGWLTNLTGPAFPTGGSMRKRRRLVLLGLVAVVAVSGLVGWAIAGSGGGASGSRQSGGGSDGRSGGGIVQQTEQTQPAQTAVATTTVVPPMTVVPDLVGKTLAQAQDEVPSSVTLNPVDTINQTAADGTVIDQDPKPGQPINGAIQLTIARAPVTVYLDSLDPATGDWSGGDNAEVGGQQLTHALITYLGDCESPHDVEYNVSKGYRQFVATAGIDDSSPDSSAKVQVQVFGDGRQLQNTTMNFGTANPISVDLSGVLRLRVEWQDISNTTNGCDDTDKLVFGEARLLGLPGEVPTTPDTATPTS
ncbi:MAG TPA: protein kinase [Pseudonocardiaceae bacterium]|jgi:serine/threonine-protein kinase|nr:protein kinase [Pseudonocardiaceae bacterium]